MWQTSRGMGFKRSQRQRQLQNGRGKQVLSRDGRGMGPAKKKLEIQILLRSRHSERVKSNCTFGGSARLRFKNRAVETYTIRMLKTFGDGIEHPLRKRAEASIEDRALAFIQAHLDVQADAVSFKCSCAGEVSDHVFVHQAIVRMFLLSCELGVLMDNRTGSPSQCSHQRSVQTRMTRSLSSELLRANQYAFSSFPGSFAHMSLANVASSTPTVLLEDAIASAEQTIDGTFNEHPPTLEFLALEVDPDAETNAWLEVFVDAHTGDVLSLTDFVTKTSSLSPAGYAGWVCFDGLIKFLSLVDFSPPSIPARTTAWRIPSLDMLPAHPFSYGLVCSGNNAISIKGPQTATTAQSARRSRFNYLQSAMTATTTTANINAARYGFHRSGVQTSRSVPHLGLRPRNLGLTNTCQNNNFGKVTQTFLLLPTANLEPCVRIVLRWIRAIADRSLSGMFLWDLTNPKRDGALENDIVTYEVRAMAWLSTDFGFSPGIHEGDIDLCFCSWNEKTTSAVPDYVLGQDVINDPASIRSHPYSSTSATVNPLRYSSLRTPTEVHSLGPTFCTTSTPPSSPHTASPPPARTNPAGNEGNIVFLHLFNRRPRAPAVQLPLPSVPFYQLNTATTVLTARTAWIQADTNRYRRQHLRALEGICEPWARYGCC
ncbi:hypothetical protein B0H14DRAFT_2655054 [Mycena olivaceomarginata]|nr:hypothetical protein B0H14DRAFT_2655054 [Mycena olivaceomarginata]